MTQRRLRIQEYTAGWVFTLPIELAAATKMVDEEHQDLLQDGNETNLCTLSRIGEHNVVLLCLPAGQMGTSCAAAVAIKMQSKSSPVSATTQCHCSIRQFHRLFLTWGRVAIVQTLQEARFQCPRHGYSVATIFF